MPPRRNLPPLTMPHPPELHATLQSPSNSLLPQRAVLTFISNTILPATFTNARPLPHSRKPAYRNPNRTPRRLTTRCVASVPRRTTKPENQSVPTSARALANLQKALTTHLPTDLQTPTHPTNPKTNLTTTDLTHPDNAPPPPSPPPTPLWPRALVLLVAAIFGTNFPVVKFLQTGTEPLAASTAALARFSIATVALLPAVVSELRRSPRLPRGLLAAALLTGVPVSVGYFTQALSLDGTDAGKSAFLCSLAVVCVPILQRVFPSLRSQPAAEDGTSSPLATWGAPLLAVVGVAFLELSGAAPPTGGDAWGLVQAMAFGLGFILNERTAKRFSGFSLTVSAIQLAVVSVLSGVWATVDLSSASHALTFPMISDMMGDPMNCLGLLYTGLVSTSLAVVLSNVALSHVSAGELTVLYSTEPIWAAAFAALALDERMGGGALVGGVVILAACLVNQAAHLPVGKARQSVRKFVASPWTGAATSFSCLNAFISWLHPPSS